MQKPTATRRQALTRGLSGLASGVAGLVAVSARPAQAHESCGGMTSAEFHRYIELFNNNDSGYEAYYHPDVVLELGNTQLSSAQAIMDFYAEVKTYIKETVQIDQFISDSNGIACEFSTEFRCIKDWDDSYFRRDLKAGEVMRRIGFVHYSLDSGKFRHIKTALYRLVNDWRMDL